MRRLKPDQELCLLAVIMVLGCAIYSLYYSGQSKEDGTMIEKIFNYYYNGEIDE